MLSKIYSLIVYISMILSGIYFSFVIRLNVLYGHRIQEMFKDPKELGVDFYLTVSKYSWILNYYIILPLGILFTIYVFWKKLAYRDTIILFIINCILFYYFDYRRFDYVYWIFD